MTTPGSPELEVRPRTGTGLGTELTTTSAGPADRQGGGTEVNNLGRDEGEITEINIFSEGLPVQHQPLFRM